MTEKHYQTPCGAITYWINAPLDTAKPTLLFLPGLTADHRLFNQQIATFRSGYNVFVWDAPAHASSWPFTLDFTLRDKARWLKEMMDAEGIRRGIIIGQSMGGYVGQMFAENYPDRLAGFVSIDSAPLQRQYVTGWELWLLKRMEPIYRHYPWKSLLRAGSKGVAATAYGQQLMLDMMMVYNDNPTRYAQLTGHGYRMLAEAMEADLPYTLSCPALLICGTKDQAGSTRRYNKAWHQKTGIPLEWIEGAGHNANTDKPQEVNALIARFLKQLEQDSN